MALAGTLHHISYGCQRHFSLLLIRYIYTGVGLITIQAAIGLFIYLRNRKEVRSRSFYTAFKLLIIGAAIQLVSGPGDFMWHSVFGVDGLMSPPHLALATGILINTIAAVVGLARILPLIQSKRNQALARAALVPAFAALWFSSIWYIFMFVLPLSNGEHFRFNPDPAAAIVIATIALPFVSAMIFLLSARTIGKLGAASAVAGVIITMNVLANIAPAYQSLGAFLPWQTASNYPSHYWSRYSDPKSRSAKGYDYCRGIDWRHILCL